jgi:UDP-N-acetylglucosamine 2-epimerase
MPHHKIITIFGTRPQFIKACLISKKLKKKKIEEITIHTGQHYDINMSGIFFKSLDIPTPNYVLNIQEKCHGAMTGKMIIELEKIILNNKPTCIIVYGDCNTTVAGALVASKLNIPVIHIEAGLRSFDKQMPEEINRIVTDHISSYLFCPTENSVKNLEMEGITKNVFLTGDLMIELLRENIEKIKVNFDFYLLNEIKQKKYYLATIHRQSNTTLSKIKNILSIFSIQKYPVLFCIHPRTKDIIKNNNIKLPKNIICINPVGYLEILKLLFNSRALFTDSGGLQKEAYELKIPCFTLRKNTEWKELVSSGWNILGLPTNVEKNIETILNLDHPELYINDTSEKITNIIQNIY